MRFGLAPVQSRTTFDAMRAQAALAESLGFGTLWAHEHHSQQMMYPSPLMTAAALATATRHVRIGTNMLLLPLHHPLRVAGDGAMVDVLSGGRLTLGVAAGYAADEFAAFGIRREERGTRMREGLELIRAAWTTRPLTREGLGFALEDYELFPPPVQQPSPPIWVGAGAPVALRRAARLGDGLVLSATQDVAGVREAVTFFRAAEGGAGKTVALNRVVHVVEGRAARVEAARFFSERYLSFYDRWGHPRIAGLDSAERVHEITAREHFVLGEPGECLERLHEYAEAGVQEIACLMNFGKPDLDTVERSMRLFAEKVAPHAP
jgi:alkanesulfonate monooxygenase SsuD/methylene tetrahydromethanopterin reductase-like flavin-dependent oxidoreductase (luciferase family)